MRTAAFSIISPNYRHFARVLMSSIQAQHPEWDRYVLIVGDAAADEEAAFHSVSIHELPLPHARQFEFRYDIIELNTAVKPWMFEHVFARGYDRVVYLDPDIFVYSRLDELPEAFMTVTPHLTGFIGGDQFHPSERTILKAGAYNLGFLALTRGPELEKFLGWWQKKLEFHCVFDTQRGLFVDQRWIDLAPGLFEDVAILRHEGYNVAYWNLRQRTVRGRTVNGQPLRFFHFSGYDPAMPELVSRHDRLTSEEVGDARLLLDAYGAELRTAGSASFRTSPYAFGRFSDGTPVTTAMRVAYRQSPELQAAAGEDPFRHPKLFRRIQDHTRGELAAKAGVKSYRVLSSIRPVVALLPRSVRTRAREFLLGRPDHEMNATAQPRSSTEVLPPGLNVVGYVTRTTGVGESARLCISSCAAAGIPTHTVDVDAAGAEAKFNASIFHVNADQTPDVRHRLAAVFEESAYNIGCWHWELPELPDEWIPSGRMLQEIWAPSAFIQSAVSMKVNVPVVHMPHGVEVTEIEPCSPRELGVPEGRFVFLCMFDLNSVMQRKNPMGAVDAFRRAFGDRSDVALLVKTARAQTTHGQHFTVLEEQLRGIPNIYLTDQTFSRARVNGLIAACDAIVSLHRSEGFGLILAEGMCLGKPVIGTGWSGNMDFMTVANSCPVAYELVEIDRDYHLYHAGNRWAEPDLDHAASCMRRIVDDAGWRQQIGARAAETMREEFSFAAAGRRYRKRLQFLGLMPGKTGN